MRARVVNEIGYRFSFMSTPCSSKSNMHNEIYSGQNFNIIPLHLKQNDTP